MGLHGLEQGYLYLFFYCNFFCAVCTGKSSEIFWYKINYLQATYFAIMRRLDTYCWITVMQCVKLLHSEQGRLFACFAVEDNRSSKPHIKEEVLGNSPADGFSLKEKGRQSKTVTVYVQAISVYYIKRTFWKMKLRTNADYVSTMKKVLTTNIWMRPRHSWIGLVAGFPPWRLEFKPGSSHVGFVLDKVGPVEVFSEYFGFPCQFSFHQYLHNHHHPSSRPGAIGQ
jgi:hypothetical protein